MIKKLLLSLSLVLMVSASAAANTFEFTVQKLENEHRAFILAHHLGGSLANPLVTDTDVKFSRDGAPISIFFNHTGVSTYFTTKDGTTIHTLIKSHKIGIFTEGFEIALNLSVNKTPVMEFHRVYGIMEMDILIADLKAANEKLRDPEWRETVKTLGKMLLCAQLDKLPASKRVPAFVVGWITSALKPVCQAE